MIGAGSGPALPSEAARRQARVQPGGLAVVDGSRRWTWAELDRRADVVAEGMVRAGLAPGQAAALLAGPSASALAVVHGTGRAGRALVPLGTRLTATELRAALAETRPRLIVHDARRAAVARALASSTDTLAVSLDALVSGWPGARPAPTGQAGAAAASVALGEATWLRPTAPVVMVLTSGTTGQPRAAVLGLANLAASAAAWNAFLPPSTGWLLCLPLAHVAGLGIVVRATLAGCPVVVMRAFDPAAVLAALRAEEPSHLSLVASQLARLLDLVPGGPPPASLRAVLLGGGPLPPALVTRALEAGWPVVPSYGLTETASGVTALATREARSRPGSSGRPLPGVELRIIDPHSPARLVGPGEPGEIAVRGPMLFAGYAGRPDDTAAALGRDGWLRTGDLGRLDGEGYLSVLDRRLDLIVSGGENVSPAEVESVLAAHPAVADAGVVGLADPTWGRVPVAAVVLRAGVAPPGPDELRAFCRDRLAPYKVPARIDLVAVLPRSESGKLRRPTLVALLSDQARTGGAGRPEPAGPGSRVPTRSTGAGGVLRTVARPDGSHLSFRVAGLGQTVLLLHATLSSSAQLSRLVALLAEGASVVAMDRRGHAASRLPAGSVTAASRLDIGTHLADALAVLDAEGVDAAVVVGHSLGAVVALELAARHPHRVRAVVAWEPPYGGLPDESLRARFAAVAGATVEAYAGQGPAAAAEAFLRQVGGDASFEALGARARAGVMAEGDGALLDATLGGLEVGRLAAITAPVVLATGERSEPFYAAIADALASRIRGARRVVLPGLRHAAPITDPAEVASLVRAVLEAGEAPGRADGPPPTLDPAATLRQSR